jgi:hypothetical protein
MLLRSLDVGVSPPTKGSHGLDAESTGRSSTSIRMNFAVSIVDTSWSPTLGGLGDAPVGASLEF